jgi:hypothetical protein
MLCAILIASGDAGANLTDGLVDVLHRVPAMAVLVARRRIEFGSRVLQVGERLLHVGLVDLRGR